MSKCRDGVDLPTYGPCPVCGAEAWQECRTQSYAAYMKIQAAMREQRQAAGDLKDWDRDRRLGISNSKTREL
jgi:hypothetical protein